MDFKIDNLENNRTTIPKENLLVGQSGIVVHIYDTEKTNSFKCKSSKLK